MFAFRYECQSDLGHLMVNAVNFCRKQNAHLRIVCIEGDVVHVDTDLTLDGLRDLLRTIPDGHLMVQTANHAAEFTGERMNEVM